jgi:biotin transporter BioY
LPVFTPTVPLVGVARLIGPTGGYLLAYPIAAFAVGWLTDPGRKPGERPSPAPGTAPERRPGENPNRAPVPINPGLAPGVSEPSWLRVGLGVFAGLVLIHLGGLAQLLILTGDLSAATRFGTLPFLLGDLGKLAIALLVLKQTVTPLRARL